MKVIPYTFLFILTISSLSLNAQEWLPDGTTWHYTNSSWGRAFGVNTYTILGETEVLGKTCKILNRSTPSCDLRPQLEYLFKQNDSLFYFESSINEFRLLYDFSAEVGDTMAIALWEGIGQDSIYIKIDSISTFLLETLSLKRFHVSYGFPGYAEGIYFSEYSYPSNVIIEDIGSVGNFFHLPENGGCDQTHTLGIRCFEHPEFGLAKFTTEACDSVIVSVQKLNRISNIKVYPNPSSSHLNVVVDDFKPKYWEIRDITGSVILSSNRHMSLDQQIEIDISKLENATYTLIITNKQNKVSVERFIKM